LADCLGQLRCRPGEHVIAGHAPFLPPASADLSWLREARSVTRPGDRRSGDGMDPPISADRSALRSVTARLPGVDIRNPASQHGRRERRQQRLEHSGLRALPVGVASGDHRGFRGSWAERRPGAPAAAAAPWFRRCRRSDATGRIGIRSAPPGCADRRRRTRQICRSACSSRAQSRCG
jgi:hypothetical protein